MEEDFLVLVYVCLEEMLRLWNIKAMRWPRLRMLGC